MTQPTAPPSPPQSCQSLEELRKRRVGSRGTGSRMVMSPLVIPEAQPVGNFPFGLIWPQFLRLLLRRAGQQEWPGD